MSASYYTLTLYRRACAETTHKGRSCCQRQPARFNILLTPRPYLHITDAVADCSRLQ